MSRQITIKNIYYICRRLSENIQQLVKHTQTKQERRRAIQKPKCLPISTELEMETFEMADEDAYEEVVSIKTYI